MEETILDLPKISQRYDDLEVARWQFQCDKGPFQETDPTKWTWQNYSDDENLIIEESFNLNKEVADLRDYEIDFKKMLQVSKEDKNKIRRVRRQETSRFLMKIPEARVIIKDKKTMNDAFGTVQHFLEYIMKRTPEAYTLYQRLKASSLDCNRVEFEDLFHQVAVCIEKGAEARAKIIKTRTGSKVRDFILEAGKVIKMMEDNSLTLRDFLGAILKAYTMETFICYWLNELLRSEHWEEINVLTPYLACLLYVFKLSDYVLKEQNSEKAINDKLGFVVKHRLYLYRGAALTEEQLVSYNPNKIKYFSWNAVTSTSRDRNEARKFVDLSLNSITNIGVMFFIEIDFDSLEDYHGMIDVSKDSQYPKEQEIILAPGTVFKLLEISLIESGVYEIHLKATKDIKEAQEEVALLGIMQEQAILKDKAIIDGLPSQKGFKMLELLRGNKMIRKLEIRDSGIEQHIMEEIENIRVTTYVRKEDIRLVDNTIVTSSLKVLAHYFSPGNLSDILMLNKVRFRGKVLRNNPQISQESQIENLILKDQAIEMLRCSDQLKELWEELKTEGRILEISLSIQKLQILENELRDFFECLKEWKFLESLSLTLNETQAISIENFSSLCQVISSSINLNILSLKLRFSDEGLRLLGNIFIFLTPLRKLFLQFEGCNEISDEGLSYLAKTITSLTSLEHLHFRFKKCNRISDQSLKSLQNGIISFKVLNHLSWEFSSCDQISIAGLDYLINLSTSSTSLEQVSNDVPSWNQTSDEDENYCNIELSELKQIASLSPFRYIFLDLRFCKQITGQNQDFQKTLTSLSLESDLLFNLPDSERSRISDLAVTFLTLRLTSLRSLQHLSLNFGSCWRISDRGVSVFISRLAFLTSLQHLSLDFGHCSKISLEGLNDHRNGLSSLTSLQHLSLNFQSCWSLSDEGFDYINRALASLTLLQHLSLNFGYCREISNDGLNSLGCALISLTSLQYLSLDFRNCSNISDVGLICLKRALTLLTSLQNLSLNFQKHDILLNSRILSFASLQDFIADLGDRKKISNTGRNRPKTVLTSLASLTSLQHLSLNFENCSHLSNDGLRDLKIAFISLTSLKYLSLDLGGCCKISDVGLRHLSNGLVSLISLTHLSLNLQSRGIIFDVESSSNDVFKQQFLFSNQPFSIDLSDVTLKYLSRALVSLTSLQHLSLDFEGCKMISDIGLQYLNNGFVPLTSLQHLSLNFNNCSQISDDGLNYLHNGLISLLPIQYLDLKLKDCLKVSSERIEHLKIELKSIPSLTISNERIVSSLFSYD